MGILDTKFSLGINLCRWGHDLDEVGVRYEKKLHVTKTGETRIYFAKRCCKCASLAVIRCNFRKRRQKLRDEQNDHPGS